jgi:hypothetical protein
MSSVRQNYLSQSKEEVEFSSWITKKVVNFKTVIKIAEYFSKILSIAMFVVNVFSAGTKDYNNIVREMIEVANKIEEVPKLLEEFEEFLKESFININSVKFN